MLGAHVTACANHTKSLVTLPARVIGSADIPLPLFGSLLVSTTSNRSKRPAAQLSAAADRVPCAGPAAEPPRDRLKCLFRVPRHVRARGPLSRRTLGGLSVAISDLAPELAIHGRDIRMLSDGTNALSEAEPRLQNSKRKSLRESVLNTSAFILYRAELLRLLQQPDSRI